MEFASERVHYSENRGFIITNAVVIIGLNHRNS